ncbi:MAG TPA: hypothetical protein VG755_31105, partial [Nannocystaceae bacterium]|nr:hypothetical protein [Nannocystaceae bacterium]
MKPQRHSFDSAYRQLGLGTLLVASACADDGSDAHEPPTASVDEHDAEAAPGASDSQASTHGYDAVRRPVDVLLSSELDVAETLTPDDVLEATLFANAPERMTVDVSVVVSALGHEDVALPLGSWELAEGESETVRVRIGDLPLRVVGADATVSFAASVERTDASPTELRSLPVHVRFAGDGTLARVEAGERRHPDATASLIAASEELVAQASIVADDGTLRAVDRIEPAPVPGLGLTADDDPFAEPPPGANDRLCARWRAHYDDAEAMQDYLNAAGTQHVAASYAWVTVTTPWVFFPNIIPGTLVWEGYLDAGGCTPWLALPNGNYVYSLGTKHKRGELEFQTRYNSQDANYIGWASGSFTVTGSGTKSPLVGDDNRATRIATLISRALV